MKVRSEIFSLMVNKIRTETTKSENHQTETPGEIFDYYVTLKICWTPNSLQKCLET